MYKVKRYIIAIGMMLITSVVSLLVVSTFTYLFKWQADKAMIGIFVTYVLAGFIGGFCLRKGKRGEIRRKVIESLILANIFTFLLILFSYIIFQIPFELSSRFLLIWMLIVCSSFGGTCCKR